MPRACLSHARPLQFLSVELPRRPHGRCQVRCSAVTGKAVGNAPGATVNDIPWLKLDVVNRRGSGTLADVTTVQRINTRGGAAQGACDQAGAFRSVPYSADYVFLSKRK